MHESLRESLQTQEFATLGNSYIWSLTYGNKMSDDDDSEIPYAGSRFISEVIGIDELKATMISSLSTFVLTTLFFTVITGCVCGYQKCKKKSHDAQPSNPVAMYEDVIIQSSARQQESILELKSNVAYSSSPFLW